MTKFDLVPQTLLHVLVDALPLSIIPSYSNLLFRFWIFDAILLQYLSNKVRFTRLRWGDTKQREQMLKTKFRVRHNDQVFWRASSDFLRFLTVTQWLRATSFPSSRSFAGVFPWLLVNQCPVMIYVDVFSLLQQWTPLVSI